MDTTYEPLHGFIAIPALWIDFGNVLLEKTVNYVFSLVSSS